jgi:hypothetical protein
MGANGASTKEMGANGASTKGLGANGASTKEMGADGASTVLSSARWIVLANILQRVITFSLNQSMISRTTPEVIYT